MCLFLPTTKVRRALQMMLYYYYIFFCVFCYEQNLRTSVLWDGSTVVPIFSFARFQCSVFDKNASQTNSALESTKKLLFQGVQFLNVLFFPVKTPPNASSECSVVRRQVQAHGRRQRAVCRVPRTPSPHSRRRAQGAPTARIPGIYHCINMFTFYFQSYIFYDHLISCISLLPYNIAIP